MLPILIAACSPVPSLGGSRHGERHGIVKMCVPARREGVVRARGNKGTANGKCVVANDFRCSPDGAGRNRCSPIDVKALPDCIPVVGSAIGPPIGVTIRDETPLQNGTAGLFTHPLALGMTQPGLWRTRVNKSGR